MGGAFVKAGSHQGFINQTGADGRVSLDDEWIETVETARSGLPHDAA